MSDLATTMCTLQDNRLQQAAIWKRHGSDIWTDRS